MIRYAFFVLLLIFFILYYLLYISDLSYNKITTVDKSIGNLINLTTL